MTSSSSAWEPEGPLVPSVPAIAPSRETTLVGKHVDLIPLLESHAEELYNDLGGLENGRLYKYLFGGPYDNVQSFAEFIKSVCDQPSVVPFAIRSKVTPDSVEGKPGPLVGIIIYLNIVPVYRSIEIGLVVFGPRLGRTTGATETCYLLMKHAFEDLHNLRVEWKANNLNEASKRAATRLGFVFEGIFRKHMVIKGRSRDSAYFSITDDDWEGGVKEALQCWLADENFDGEQKQKSTLDDIRKRIVATKK